VVEQQSLVALAVDEIRRLILEGILLPGERLYEPRLAEQLGMSRPPLRESLRILEGQRILEQTPRHGYRVVELTPEDVEEIYTLRAALERFAITQALPHLGDEDLAEVKASVAAMWEAARKDDRAGVVAANRRFHIAMVALARHSRLDHAYSVLMDQMQLCMSDNLRREAQEIGDLFEGCLRHDRLLKSLQSRRTDDIETALAAHGERSYLSPPE
jgi:DNA-binding GntR family transcriptional regulator